MQPCMEFAFHVGIYGQVVRLLTVALEKPRESLPGVHDSEEAGIMDQFLVAVWAWRCGGNEPIWNTRQQRQELLIGF